MRSEVALEDLLKDGRAVAPPGRPCLGFRVQDEGPHAMHHWTIDVHEKRGREGTTEGRRRRKGERAEARGTKEVREGRRGRGRVGDKGEHTADTKYQNPMRIRLTHTHTCTHTHRRPLAHITETHLNRDSTPNVLHRRRGRRHPTSPHRCFLTPCACRDLGNNPPIGL
jgi:hypothetical protein